MSTPTPHLAGAGAGEVTRPRLSLPGSGGCLVIDPATGLPAGIELPEASGLAPLAISSSIELVVGGREARALTGGLEYPGTAVLSEPKLTSLEVLDGVLQVASALSTWSLVLGYRAVSELPRARLAFELTRGEGDVRPLRNVELELTLQLEDPGSWLLHAPGNRLAPGTCLAELDAELAVSPAAGSLGSLGLVALCHRGGAASVLLWPFSRSEIGWITLTPVAGGVRMRVVTDLAGDPAPGEALAYAGLNLDAIAAGWQEVRGQIRSALASLGVRSPGAKPAWARSAAIYEVQVGRSVFSDGYCYEPYPQLADVTADLERIGGLGFDTIQLMPRQPYPSYNVHDYDDTTTTYGGDESLSDLVLCAHELGLRVVLDIVLHGVLDRRSVESALHRVDESGILAGPAPSIGDVFADTPASRAALRRAWCQHIYDFAPYWIEGSPEVHHLTVEHPDWFCRDSAGELTGIYTEAFDLAEESFQAWFCQKVLDLCGRYDLDGFRFDAPTYNNFANWSRNRRSRASASSTGCVALFERLRQMIKARFPEVLMFTEPSGVVLRESMDLNYNYDELWLVPALTAPSGKVASVSSGAQLAAWLGERDATLPADALTAHHLDSHDSFWWPAPGRKWRREQIGVAATRALTWCLAFCGGPFFMFTGGEAEIEEDLRRTMTLRRQRLELSDGGSDYSSATVEHQSVFAVLRHHGATATLVLVNLSPRRLSTACNLSAGWQVARFADYYATPATAPAALVRPGRETSLLADLEPYGLALVELAR